MTAVELECREDFQSHIPAWTGISPPPMPPYHLDHRVELEPMLPGECAQRKVMREKIRTEAIENACSSGDFHLSCSSLVSKCWDSSTSYRTSGQQLFGCIVGEPLSERLKVLRVAANRTQAQFAAYMGVTLNTYQRYEKGAQVPGADKIAGLKNHLKDVSLSWLLVGIGEMLELPLGTSYTQEAEEDPEIAELLMRAREVLKSGNQLAFDALSRNIMYFAHAVKIEKRLNEMEARMAAMEQKLQHIEEPVKPLGESEKREAM